MDYTNISAIAQNNPEVVEAGQEELNKILARTATDIVFRTRLLADPRAALAEALGREIPQSFDISFIENTAGATVVLPDYVDPEAELSEGELEVVAGGLPIILVGAAALYAGYQVGRLIEEIAD